MPIKLKLLAIAVSLFIFFFVIDLIRRKKLTFQYAVSWLAASLFGLAAAIFDDLFFTFAGLLGFTLPSNFIFFLISVVMVILSLVLTVYLCHQTNRIETMAQKLSLLEMELAGLKKEAAQRH